MSDYIIDPSNYLMISPVGDFILYSFCTIAGLLINYKFLHVMKQDDERNRQRGQRERMLVKDFMTTATFMRMIFYPPQLLIKWWINSGLSLPGWSFHLFCYQRLLMYSVRSYLAFSSLAVAMMRFAFIVHQDKVTSWGPQRVRKLFYYASIIIPFTLAILLDSSFFSDSSQKPPPYFVCLKSYEVPNNSSTTEYSVDITSFQSPLHSFTHLYLPKSITEGIRLVSLTLLLIIYTNLTEAVFYWRIFSRIRRYEYD